MANRDSSRNNDSRVSLDSTDTVETRLARLRHRYGATIIAFIILSLGIALIAVGVESHFVRDLGIALVPVGLIGLIYELFLRKLFIEEMKEEIAQCLKNQFSSVERITTSGLIDVFESDPEEVGEAFAKAKKIKILQTHIPGLIQLRQHFEEAPADCMIEILILHPESDFAKVRSIELGYINNTVIGSKIIPNLADLERFCREEGRENQVKIRLYDATPVISIYSYENSQDDVVIYCGIFWNKRAALEGPQFKINGKSFLGQTIESHFLSIWESALELPFPFTEIPKLPPAVWKREDKLP